MVTATEAIKLCGRKTFIQDGKEKVLCLLQLKKLLQLYEENDEFLEDCLQKDYNTEASFFDILYLKEEVKKNIKNFYEKNKTQRFYEGYFLNKVKTIASKPLGTILLVADENFPLYFPLMPLASALSSGNRIIIRPSEEAPITTNAFAKLLGKYLNDDRCQIVTGDSSVVEELMSFQFDHIVYMGNTEGARKIYAANRHLIPITCLLNGKSPVFMDETVDLESAVRCLLWKKFCYLSESCITPDYVMCNTLVANKFVSMAQKILNEMCEPGQKSSFKERSYSDKQFNLMKGLLKHTKGRIVIGGDVDEKERRISPTVVIDVEKDDSLLTEEFCGPVLTIVKTLTVYDAIHFVRNIKPNPVVAYAFTNKKTSQVRLMQQLTSSFVYFNDMASPIVDTNGSVLAAESTAIFGGQTFELFTSNKTAFRGPLNSSTDNFEEIRDRIFAFKKSHESYMLPPDNFFSFMGIKIIVTFILILIIAKLLA